MKWKIDEVMEPISQETGVRQRHSLSRYLFNIFVDDIDHIKKRNIHTPVVGELRVPCLLLADGVPASSFTISGLQ